MLCFWRIWTSGHNFVRKIFLMILTVYSNSSAISARIELTGGQT